MSTTEESKNIIQGLLEEIARNRELLKEYERIPEGIFGVAVIKHTIARAELAMAQGDTIAMIIEYQNLKETQ